MSAPTNLKNLFAAATSNGTTVVTLFTHGTGLKNPDGTSGYGGVLDRVTFYNNDTVAHWVWLYRVPAAGSATLSTVIERVSVPSGASYILEGPFYSTDSAFYQFKLGDAITSDQVYAQAYYHEMS